MAVWRISSVLTTSTKIFGRKFRTFLVMNETALKQWKTFRIRKRGKPHDVYTNFTFPLRYRNFWKSQLKSYLHCLETFAGNFGTTKFWFETGRFAARIENAPCEKRTWVSWLMKVLAPVATVHTTPERDWRWEARTSARPLGRLAVPRPYLGPCCSILPTDVRDLTLTSQDPAMICP